MNRFFTTALAVVLLPCMVAAAMAADRPLDTTPYDYAYHAGCGPQREAAGFTSESGAAGGAYAAMLELEPGYCGYPVRDSDPWATSPTYAECGSSNTLPIYSGGIELKNIRQTVHNLLGMSGGECVLAGNFAYWLKRTRTASCPPGTTFNVSTNTCPEAGSDVNKADACQGGCNGTDPINSRLLVEFKREVDVQAPDSLFAFERYYVSRATHWREGVMGPNWRHSFERRIYTTSSGGLTATAVIRPDGKKFFFNHGAGGTLTPDPDVVIRLLAGQSDTVSTGWRVLDEQDRVETYDADGFWISTVAPSGQALYATYDAGELAAISDEAGRTYVFEYGTAGDHRRLTGLVLPSGLRIRYAYKTSITQAPLEKVYFPSGSPSTEADDSYKKYYETGGLLTGIDDERGIRSTTIRYDAWGVAQGSFLGDEALYASRVGLVDLGDGRTQVYRFTSPPVGSTPHQYTTPIFSFTLLHGVYRFASMDGACPECGNVANVKAMTYDTNGFKDQVTDQRGYITDYDHNTRGLQTKRIAAAGIAPTADENLPARRTTETDWHGSFRVPVERRVKAADNTTLVDLTRWAYNSRGQVTAQCEVDVGTTTDAVTAQAYTCGSSANAPARVRQTRYTYCDAVNLNAPDTIGATGENIGKGCPRVGLLRRVDGSRTDVADFSTLEYRLADDANCGGDPDDCTYREGDLWKSIDAFGHTSEYVSRDAEGRVTRSTDANGTFTAFAYNQRGWLLERTVRANADGTASSADATSTIEYDAHGNVTKTTDPMGVHLAYSYDSANRLVSVADNSGAHIDYVLNSLGKRTLEKTYGSTGTSQLKRRLARQYDWLGRLDVERDAMDSGGVALTGSAVDDVAQGRVVIDYGYTANELNATLATDGAGVQTRSEFDPLDRLSKMIQDDLGTDAGTVDATTEFGYDADGHLVTVKDPKALTTTYTYDTLNDHTQLSSPDTGTTTYGFDSAGNRLTQTDARSVVTSQAHDALGRLTAATYADSSLNIGYEYDTAPTECVTGETFVKARLARMTDHSGETRYCYDRRGNLARKVQVTEPTGASYTLTTRYTFDLADRVATITYPITGTVVTYARDVQGRITSVQVGTTTIVSGASYLPFGPINSLALPGSTSITHSFDGNYRPTGVQSPAIVQHYLLDVRGNITALGATAGVSTALETYHYDTLSRLKDFAQPSGTPIEAYAYDKTGNRLSKTAGTSQSYAYPSTSHRLSSIAGVSRSYDNAGNTTAIGSSTFTYDSRSRLTATSSGGAYDYNGRGERVVANGNAFAYDEGGRMLGSYVDILDLPGGPLGGCSSGGGGPGCTTTVTAAEFVWLDDVPIAYVEKTVTPLYTDTELYVVHADHLRTPRALTRASDGTVVWTWPFQANAFGQAAANDDPDSDADVVDYRLRYPGQYFDSETGLHYNYFRDYEPGTARYVESDPVGLRGGVSTYGYSLANPLRYSDSRGQSAVLVGEIFLGCGLIVAGCEFTGACEAVSDVLRRAIATPLPTTQCWGTNDGGGGGVCPGEPCKLIEEVVLGEASPIDGRTQFARICVYQCKGGGTFSKSITNNLGCPATAIQNTSSDPGINPDSGPAGR